MKAYGQISNRVGDSLDSGTLVGPLHSKVGITNYLNTLEEAKKLGGKVEIGGKVDRHT